MRLRWTEPAEHDLDKVYEYYVQEASERVAADNVLKIIHAVNSVIDMPAKTRAGRLSGTRELVLQDLPYIVPYRVVKDEVQILRVFHTAQQPPQKW